MTTPPRNEPRVEVEQAAPTSAPRGEHEEANGRDEEPGRRDETPPPAPTEEVEPYVPSNGEVVSDDGYIGTLTAVGESITVTFEAGRKYEPPTPEVVENNGA